MLRSLWSAVSGIGANQKSMDVIGNNIANVNTIGYKTGRAVFQDMFSQTLNTGKAPADSRGGVNPRQVGTGVYLVAVDNIFEQGTIKATARTHDVAIQGNGFFCVRGEGDQIFYTRAGDFNFDKYGYYTSPSGYRVQGWMSDPATGELQYSAATEDVFISKAHQVMQAKATTTVDYSGVLSTDATASTYKLNKMYTQATGRMNIFDLQSHNPTVDLGLKPTDTIRVGAHATGHTSLANIANEDGQPAGLVPSVSNIKMEVNGVQQTYTYVPGGAGVRNFDTVDQLMAAIQADLPGGSAVPPTVTVSIAEGQISINNLSTGTAFTLENITSTNTYLQTMLSSLDGSYAVNSSKTSEEIYYQTEVKATEHFNNLNQLANQIENAMNGNVTSAGFQAEFLENEFGLADGETFSITWGNAQTFTYKANPADVVAANDFHSLSQLRDAMTTAAGFLPAGVTVNVQDNKLVFNNTGAAIAGTAITVNAANSPYLGGLFSDLDTNGIAANDKTETGEFSGKGCIVYSNKYTAATDRDITGFRILKAVSGGTFNENILVSQEVDLKIGTATTDPASVTSSQRFLTTATEDTNMKDLFNLTGEQCHFVEGHTINMTAMVYGETLYNNNSFTVGIDSTLGDWMWAIEEYLGMGTEYNSKKDVTMEDGIITVRGGKGKANNIDLLTFSTNDALNLIPFTNNYGAPNRTESATGGQYVYEMPIYDEQGNKHIVRFEFSMLNEEKNEWTMKLISKNPDVSVSINGAVTNELVMRFNSDGTPSFMYDRHATPTRVVANPTFNLNANNGAGVVEDIAINVGTPGLKDGFVIAGNASTSVNTNNQDGYSIGALEQMLINEGGYVVGYYTNGQIRELALLALATFQNNQGLQKVGDTMWAETMNSGMAAIGQPQSGSRGSIASSALEQSNVDLSEEFTTMIVTQRAYQANSRVVTTSDEMIQELLNLKR